MYGSTEETINDEKFRREHGLVTTEEIKEAVLEPLVEKEKEAAEEVVEELPENLEEQKEVGETEPEPHIELTLVPDEEVTDGLTEEAQNIEAALSLVQPKPEPHKPTVGELLARLNINNIKKGVENGSAGRTEPDNPPS